MPVDVSVVIAVFNGQQFIKETLDSIVDQSISNWDCWVVDDGSTDETIGIVEEYQSRDSRFNLVKTSGGLGPYNAANIGIGKCVGKYVARIDSDDICLPDRLEVQRLALESHPDKAICCSGYYNMLPDRCLVNKAQLYSVDELTYLLMFKNPLLHSSMFFRREWFLGIGMYPGKRLAQDYFIWCSSVLNERLVVIDKPLVKWRIHQGSLTNSENASQTVHALDVNHWYLNSLFGSPIKFEVSRLFFGTFRGMRDVHPDILLEGIQLILSAQGKLALVRNRSMAMSLLYDLTYVHVNGVGALKRVLMLIYEYQPTILRSGKFLKLYLRMALKFGHNVLT